MCVQGGLPKKGFIPGTRLRYKPLRASHVTPKVHNTVGQEVATLLNADEELGYKSVEWNASGVASGVYFYRLQAGNFVQAGNLVLVH